MLFISPTPPPFPANHGFVPISMYLNRLENIGEWIWEGNTWKTFSTTLSKSKLASVSKYDQINTSAIFLKEYIFFKNPVWLDDNNWINRHFIIMFIFRLERMFKFSITYQDHKENISQITYHKENGRFTSTNQSNTNLMNTRAVVHAGEGRSPVDACAPPPTRRPHTPSSSTPAVSSCVGPAGRGALDTASQVSTRQLYSYLEFNNYFLNL